MTHQTMRNEKYAAVAGALILLLAGGCTTMVQEARKPVELLGSASRYAMVTFRPRPVHPAGKKVTLAEENKAALAYAMEYAMEYGIECAVTDTLRTDAKKAASNPYQSGLRDALLLNIRYGLAYSLQEDLKDLPEDAKEWARGQALEFARNEALPKALEYATADIRDAALREKLREEVGSALRDMLADAFDGALDAALRNSTGFVPSVCPVTDPAMYMTSRFGDSRKSRGGPGHIHQGVDLMAPLGTAVCAAADGRVSYTARERGYGNIIKVDHLNGLETWYGHLNEIEVVEGQNVASGQEIGKVGSTGYSTGPHLHYEVRKDGRPVDPEDYLGTTIRRGR